MSLTPLSIRKMRFRTRLRGYDPEEVEEFLEVVSEELTKSLARTEELTHAKHRLEERLSAAEERERELQDTLVRAQRVSDEIVTNAQREAQVMVREAELTADKIVQQAIEQAQNIERKIAELRHRRREMQLKLKNSIDLYSSILEADMSDDDERASLHRLPRRRSGEEA